MLSRAIQDVRFAVRAFAKHPVFMAVTVVTLALGIAANVTVFSFVNAVLLRPLAVRGGERLVVLLSRMERVEPDLLGFAYPEFLELSKRADIFEDLTAYAWAPANMTAGDRADRVWLAFVAPNYFKTLGVTPAHGRLLGPADGEQPGMGTAIVLSHTFWQRRFGGEPSIMGRAVRLNGRAFTVVGVAPASFTGTQFWGRLDAYVPLTMAEVLGAGVSFASHGDHSVRALGHIKAGVSLAQANAALASQVEFWRTNYGYQNTSLRLVPERRTRPDPYVSALLPRISVAFLTLAALVFLVAGANVTGLFVAHNVTRSAEIGIRRALGARPGRLVGQIVTEASLIAAPAGVLGLFLGHGAALWIANPRLPVMMPLDSLFDARLDGRLVAATVGLTVVVSVASGLVAALRLLRGDVQQSLRRTGGTVAGSSSGARLPVVLVGGQVALAGVLIVCAGLLVRSLGELRKANLGFEPANRLLASLDPGLAGYDAAHTRNFLDELVRRTRELPHVKNAALAAAVPFGDHRDGGVLFPGGRSAERDGVFVFRIAVSDDYFDTIGTALIRGRRFGAADREDSLPVVILNQAAAAKLLPGEDPLGKRLDGLGMPLTVVGVVENSSLVLAGESPKPQAFRPFAQESPSYVTLCVHTSQAPMMLVPHLRALVRSMDPNLPLFNVTSLASQVEDGFAYGLARMAAQFASAVALLGGLMALVSLGGVVWLDTRRRTREIGLRMALGSSPRALVLLVARRGLLSAVAGVLASLALVLAIGRIFSELLYGVSPADPLTLAGVGVALLVLTLLTSLIPALRAAKVDPMVALRCE
jgi:predicted permease